MKENVGFRQPRNRGFNASIYTKGGDGLAYVGACNSRELRIHEHECACLRNPSSCVREARRFRRRKDTIPDDVVTGETINRTNIPIRVANVADRRRSDLTICSYGYRDGETNGYE